MSQAAGRAAQMRQAVLGRSSAPKYLQISNTLRRRIRVGDYEPGSSLPNIDALIEEFGVARMTVLKALDDLAGAGLINRISGRGTFVAQGVWLPDITIEPDLEERHDAAVVRKTRLLDYAPLHEPLPAPFENEQTGDSHFYLRRLMSVNGQPYHVGAYYLPRAIFEMRPEQVWRTETVGRILARLQEVGPLQIRQTIQLDTADFALAEDLSMDLNAPIFDVVRYFTSRASNRVIGMAHLHFRADMVRFESTFDLSSEEDLRSVRGHVKPRN